MVFGKQQQIWVVIKFQHSWNCLPHLPIQLLIHKPSCLAWSFAPSNAIGSFYQRVSSISLGSFPDIPVMKLFYLNPAISEVWLSVPLFFSAENSAFQNPPNLQFKAAGRFWIKKCWFLYFIRGSLSFSKSKSCFWLHTPLRNLMANQHQTGTFSGSAFVPMRAIFFT